MVPVRSATVRFAGRLCLGAACLLVPHHAGAQTLTALAGYEWVHSSAENVHLMTPDLNGWSAGVIVPAQSNVGIVIQADGVYAPLVATGIVVRPRGTVRPFHQTVEGGPRYTFRPRARLALFAEGVVGVVHAQATTFGVDFIAPVIDTRFTWGVDGGVRVVLFGPAGVESGAGYRQSELFDQRLSRFQLTERFFVDLGHR
jgi:hypothetical protein